MVWTALTSYLLSLSGHTLRMSDSSLRLSGFRAPTTAWYIALSLLMFLIANCAPKWMNQISGSLVQNLGSLSCIIARICASLLWIVFNEATWSCVVVRIRKHNLTWNVRGRRYPSALLMLRRHIVSELFYFAAISSDVSPGVRFSE